MPPIYHMHTILLLSHAIIIPVAGQQLKGYVPLFQDCDASTYYDQVLGAGASTATTATSSLPPPPSRAALHNLVRTTQRDVLPYTSSYREDTWDGLIDLDGTGGDNNNDGKSDYVGLIYASDRVIASTPHGTSDSWNREHLWPKSAGVGTGGPDYTDLHHLRPSFWALNSARGNKWFGECGIGSGEQSSTTRSSSECRRPAHELAAQETETDSEAWLPPPHVRGDIARALLFMDLRYDGDMEEYDLILTDCPHLADDDGRISELGYLSQLLQWHVDDPVDDAEIERNGRVCERWQGNRNPFIDHPHWVETYFGTPGTLLDDGNGYAECSLGYVEPVTEDNGDDGGTGNDEDDVSTLVPEDNGAATQLEGSCNGLSTGDVAVIAVGSDNPDVVALVALTDIKEGTDIYVTDNAWVGSKLRTNEGTIKLHVKGGGLSAGSIVVYGGDMASGGPAYDWESIDGSFSLSASGDTVIVYCRDGPGSSSDRSDITFLSAISYNGEWMDENTADETAFGSNGSALPPLLIGDDGILSLLFGGMNVAAVTLQHTDNAWYTGQRSGTKDDLWSSLRDEYNWEESNTDAPKIGAGFSVFDATASSSATTVVKAAWTRGLVCSMMILFTCSFF